MISNFFYLLIGFVLGLVYSKGKERPLRSAWDDACRITRTVTNWVREQLGKQKKERV